nr:hypothetical protein GCM10020093_089680 [Planobispora longispora]
MTLCNYREVSMPLLDPARTVPPAAGDLMTHPPVERCLRRGRALPRGRSPNERTAPACDTPGRFRVGAGTVAEGPYGRVRAAPGRTGQVKTRSTTLAAAPPSSSGQCLAAKAA